MRRWWQGVRGALKMGLTWAIAWGIGVGGFIELVGNIFPNAPIVGLVDIWPFVLAIPGFIAGATFGLVLRLADGRRRFDELSLPRFTLLGTLGGLLGGGVTVAFVSAAAGPPGTWTAAAAVIGVSTVLSTAAAAGTLQFARLAGGGRLSAPSSPSDRALPDPE